MRSLNQQLIQQLDHDAVQAWLLNGNAAAYGNRHGRDLLAHARAQTAFLRSLYGLATVDAPLLTPPQHQHKLGMATTPTYGLTLHHHRFRSLVDDRTYNLCDSAGHCTRSCVVGNSNGQYESVQRGWAWKSDLLVNYGWAFFLKLGWELRRAVMKHGSILCRPNVNSDLMWERFAPALVNGRVFQDHVTFYGYTKHNYVLFADAQPTASGGYRGDGWLTPLYRVAFSANENCNLNNATALLDGFLHRGGSLAVVTDRYYTSRTRQPVMQWAEWGVRDADKTDEWIFEPGVIGDLAFKPRTSALRRWGYSDATQFVHNVYQGTPVVLDNIRKELQPA